MTNRRTTGDCAKGGRTRGKREHPTPRPVPVRQVAKAVAKARGRSEREAQAREQREQDEGVRELAPLESAGIEWTDEALTTWSSSEPTRLPWPDVVALVAEPPWPGLRVRWRSGDVLCSARFVPPASAGAAVLALRVSELFAYAPAGAPEVALVRGWLDVADVSWERARWPIEPEPDTPSQGPFRSSFVAPRPDPVLAHRTRRTPMEALLHWLASRPGLEWRAQPIEVAVTASYVFVRRRKGVFQVPLDALARVETTASGDLVATFGRSTRLVLPFRKGCPVAALFLGRGESATGERT